MLCLLQGSAELQKRCRFLPPISCGRRARHLAQVLAKSLLERTGECVCDTPSAVQPPVSAVVTARVAGSVGLPCAACGEVCRPAGGAVAARDGARRVVARVRVVAAPEVVPDLFVPVAGGVGVGAVAVPVAGMRGAKGLRAIAWGLLGEN